MKYTITINQYAAYKLELIGKLDLVDLSIFGAFKDFANSNRCSKFMENGRVWFWIDYSLIIEELPLCKIKTKDGIYRRMCNLAAAEIIEFHPDNAKKGKSFFAWGKNYDQMICFLPTDEKPRVEVPTDEKPDTPGSKTVPPPDQKPDNNNTNNNTTKLTDKTADKKSAGHIYSDRDVAKLLEIPEQVFYAEVIGNKSWPNFIEYRRARDRKNPYKLARSESLAIKELFEFSAGNPETAEIILKKSESKGWAGFFKLDQKNGAEKNSTGADTGSVNGFLFGSGSDQFYSGINGPIQEQPEQLTD